VKKVLVTGAGGLIGGSAVVALRKAGHDVTALYREFLPPETGNEARSLTVDLLDDGAPDILSSIDAEAVVHCAAISPQNFQGDDAAHCARLNGIMDERIVSFCREGNRRLIYLSGTSVYGTGGHPWHEESPLLPQGAYVGQKVVGESLCMKSVNHPLVLRVSSPYGFRQRKSTVLSIFLQRAIRGDDLFYHGSGERTQDFVSADDVARAITIALVYDDVRGVFNIASGAPVSMKRLAELVLEAVPSTGSRILPSGQPDPQEDYRAVIAIEKARSILGWSPSLSLPDGIRKWLKHMENEA
jgi:nucleoside-diphosphate-sugar epimerase